MNSCALNSLLILRRAQMLHSKWEMTKKIISGGVVHEVPQDLRKALVSNLDILDKWNNLTPIARNEWICWTTIVRKAETRREHIERLCSELLEGKRRPCCWPGCPHRRTKAKKWFRCST